MEPIKVKNSEKAVFAIDTSGKGYNIYNKGTMQTPRHHFAVGKKESAKQFTFS